MRKMIYRQLDPNEPPDPFWRLIAALIFFGVVATIIYRLTPIGDAIRAFFGT